MKFMKILAPSQLMAWAFVVLAGAATAGCPNNAPKINWNTHSGDQRVDDAYLKNLLPGKKVKFGADGTEIYHKDGAYTYRTSSGNFDAPSYTFYSNGIRCINYANPRFDLYVVNDKRLILINAKGWRGEGQVTR